MTTPPDLLSVVEKMAETLKEAKYLRGAEAREAMAIDRLIDDTLTIYNNWKKDELGKGR